MRITKKDFERFKKEFLRWVEKLGLKDYRFTFYHKMLNNDYAKIDINESGKNVCVFLTNQINKFDIEGWESPELHAKHEAIHVLLFKLEHLGRQRYVSPGEFDDESEALVRVLEKVL